MFVSQLKIILQERVLLGTKLYCKFIFHNNPISMIFLLNLFFRSSNDFDKPIEMPPAIPQRGNPSYSSFSPMNNGKSHDVH